MKYNAKSKTKTIKILNARHHLFSEFHTIAREKLYVKIFLFEQYFTIKLYIYFFLSFSSSPSPYHFRI